MASVRIRNNPEAQDDLLKRWQQISELWQLRGLRVFEMGIHSSVQAVEMLDSGEEAVLKLFITAGIFDQQLRALEMADSGPGIIRADRKREALLMELLPGSPGVTSRFEIALADKEIARWHQSDGQGLPGLAERHLEIAASCKSHGLAEEALGMADFFDRHNRSGIQGLVHGDLVPENIICDGHECRFLDPSGYRGDQSFDWATLALYSAGEDLPGMLSQASLLSGIPMHRLAAWAWLRAVLSDAQERKALGKGNETPSHLLAQARAVEPLWRTF